MSKQDNRIVFSFSLAIAAVALTGSAALAGDAQFVGKSPASGAYKTPAPKSSDELREQVARYHVRPDTAFKTGKRIDKPMFEYYQAAFNNHISKLLQAGDKATQESVIDGFPSEMMSDFNKSVAKLIIFEPAVLKSKGEALVKPAKAVLAKQIQMQKLFARIAAGEAIRKDEIAPFVSANTKAEIDALESQVAASEKSLREGVSMVDFPKKMLVNGIVNSLKDMVTLARLDFEKLEQASKLDLTRRAVAIKPSPVKVAQADQPAEGEVVQPEKRLASQPPIELPAMDIGIQPLGEPVMDVSVAN